MWQKDMYETVIISFRTTRSVMNEFIVAICLCELKT